MSQMMQYFHRLQNFETLSDFDLALLLILMFIYLMLIYRFCFWLISYFWNHCFSVFISSKMNFPHLCFWRFNFSVTCNVISVPRVLVKLFDNSKKTRRYSVWSRLFSFVVMIVCRLFHIKQIIECFFHFIFYFHSCMRSKAR